MEIKHKTELKERMEADGKEFAVFVANTEEGVTIVSKFDTIEETLHKIELDLMTNLHFGFVNPIKVSIKEVKE